MKNLGKKLLMKNRVNILFWFFLILLLAYWYFVKNLFYNWIFLWKISPDYKNNYFNQYMVSTNDPTLIWKNETIKKYNLFCHENKLNCSILPFQQLLASWQWLFSIQYVWNTLDTSKLSYLYEVLDSVSNSSPYWTYPYSFWELMLPLNNVSWVWSWIINQSYKNAVSLWEKGIFYTCDKEKIKNILNLSDEEFYKQYNQNFQTPCKDYEIPSYLGFDYFQYLKDWKNSAKNYRIASFDPQAPWITPSMVSIVTGRQWENRDSMKIWFSQAVAFSQKLETLKNKEEIEKTNNLIENALKRSVYQLQLAILSENEKDCWKNSECIIQKYVPNVYQNLAKKCQNIAFDIQNIPKNYSENIECYVFSYWLKNGWMQNFSYPLANADQKPFYGWDEKRGSWTVRFR